MILKVILNIFYNISIFMLLLSVIWCFNHLRFDLLAGAAFLLSVFILLKIRLVKQVRLLTKR